MAKKAYQYKLTLEQVQLANGEPGTHEPLTLEFTNHDEVFQIIEKIQQKTLLTMLSKLQNLRSV